ncbi:Uncharacterised protein [Chryseobacterium gleum]|uniref:Outer membrane protein/protective antigen OMA87 n=2 Tax=Chryseobacterium gleum TaxID=250 RepID=A0A448B421_CHRGE|nr:hypothetical protein [Chryseobacterium gleum]EFK36549.1 putative flagellar protein FliS [Chryseobacterium gleum ATCC 35910]QQY33391.1 hypothetical protein I6I60_06355 [Chryseobacterium gleum]VEE08839.1 Uncharacterised protein [Chryseobacterium gleum]
MKKIVLLAALVSNMALLFAQSKEISAELNKLELSNAPSVMLLGLASSDLETPKSKKAFMSSIVNSFSENDGLPNAYAVELTPTHLFPLTEMDALKYAGIKSIKKTDESYEYKNNIFSEAKNVSVSFAFLRNYKIEDLETENPSVSFSLRTTVFKIRNKKNIEAITTSSNNISRELTDIQSEFYQSQKYKDIVASNISNSEKEKKLAQALEGFVTDYYKTKTENYKKYLDEKPAFQLDIASAYSTFFLDNQFKNNQFGKLGFWMTMSSGINLESKPKPKPDSSENQNQKKSKVKIRETSTEPSKIEKRLNFYAVARYLQDRTIYNAASGFSRSNNYDFGGKIELVYNRFSIGYEFIYRSSDLDDTYRSNGIINYKVSDSVYINAAFGKNYGDKNNLITFLGLNWGLDSKRKTLFSEK